MPEHARALRDHELRAILAAADLRATSSRLVILRELSKLRAPTSHGELAERLGLRGLDRTTVYRNLLALNRAGLLVKTQLPDRITRFELPSSKSAQHNAHPHFVCSDCGAVACLPASSVALHGEAARSEVAEVQLRGRCAECVEPLHVQASQPTMSG